MAFTAFVLGISLLIYTAAAVVIIAVASAGSAVIPWKDVFWTDYQTTDSFRSYLSDRLSVLVRSAADPEGADPMTPEDTQALEELDRIREQAVAPLRRLPTPTSGGPTSFRRATTSC